MSKHITRYVPGFFAAVVGLTCLGSVADAQSRTEVTMADTGVTPENLTSGRDGTMYFGSMARGTIYRAAPGAARAEPWILAQADPAVQLCADAPPRSTSQGVQREARFPRLCQREGPRFQLPEGAPVRSHRLRMGRTTDGANAGG